MKKLAATTAAGAFLVSGGIVGVAGTSAAAAPTTPRGDAGVTQVVLHIPNCSGCSITRLRGQYYYGASKTVKNGKVTFLVPTSDTRRMAFGVSRSNIKVNYLPLLVMSYSGKSWVYTSTSTAAKARKASICWAGTKSSVAHLYFKTSWVTMAGFPAGTTKVPRIWAYPSVGSIGKWSLPASAKGIPGTQNDASCTN